MQRTFHGSLQYCLRLTFSWFVGLLLIIVSVEVVIVWRENNLSPFSDLPALCMVLLAAWLLLGVALCGMTRIWPIKISPDGLRGVRRGVVTWESIRAVREV